MSDCVETALRNNVDIAVSRLDRQIGTLGVPIEEAAFLPRFTGELDVAGAVAPSGSVLDGGLSLDQRTLTLKAGATELLPSGTSLSLTFENQRLSTDSAYQLLSPEYKTGLTLSVGQPLLKNRGRQATEAPLSVARAGQAAKTAEWMQKVMDVVAAARSAFLALFAAHGETEVRRSSLGLAERLLAEIRARVDAGSAAPMDRLPAEAAAASRREELIRAENAERNAADSLRNVLGIRSAAEWEEVLVPAGLAGEAAPPDDRDTYEEAIRRRPEMAAHAARKEQAAIEEAAARNRTLPALDLSLSAGLSGLSGSPVPSTLFPGVSASSFEGGYGDSLDQMFSGRYYNWFVGLKTEIPWEPRGEKAAASRARAALEGQRLIGEGLSLAIRADVRKGRGDLASALSRIEASRASVRAAAERLRAEEKKLSLGASTSVEVLRSQQDLSEALLAESRARVDAYLAQTRLWRAVGNIIEREGIEVR